ncbi:hypothetical protein G6F62_011562 [Rhizopus arrhizus]|uniref:Uncharacterized protein n=1 Tax=Rhizopus oryzae TaxID=64495 RepID=A0A9P6XD93_RHIOR|nr:hypothetical protein G6F23_011862 [Rhizopus arrhizus]KAG0766283.1 hypothetical protein G6F24_003735 [Rhizopus arrhizus]KAG0776766.1 hypothetical protein G6F22_012342 [Rhizopus arrhizus]KAG0792739.1 hypothetical protein G6F21_004140 [Rhizopus arrhizus]KAG0819779.1 hypothetical protein G6F20_000482 [Rhizopus arrhizus]
MQFLQKLGYGKKVYIETSFRATLALVCFVDKNSAAAVKRDVADFFNDITTAANKYFGPGATPDTTPSDPATSTPGDTVIKAPTDPNHWLKV